MEPNAYEYTTERIDHLGIVAGICNRINLIQIIDDSLPTPSNRRVSCGQATQALILNALGLSGRALYLMPEYLRNKPVDLLIGAGLVADDFNDDALGKGLDELQQAGVTELFARVAARAVAEFEVATPYVHLDTSTFSLHGAYDSETAQDSVRKMEAVEIRHGYSKEQRPDLKQVVVSLITSQASALPLWLEVLDGNSSDKESFRHSVQAYICQLEGEEPPWFIMDSAGYTHENLVAWEDIDWVARVPETIAEAKRVLRSIELTHMQEVGNGYRIAPLGNLYAGIRQRWLLVYSQQAYERESKGLDKRIDRAGEAAQKEWLALQRLTFSCPADAQSALSQFAQKLPWHLLQAQTTPIKKYAKPGRPAKDDVAQIVGWQVTGQLVANNEAIADERKWLGRFIIATNILDESRLSDPSLLSCYKEQSSSVERGFRFLKDPMFFADSLFLKSPARIMAMIMVMGLALLIYALAERHLRQQLAACNETIPDQKGKPTQTPTMRRVAQIFEGIDVLTIRLHGQMIDRRIINLTPVQAQIIRLLGPAVENCYLVET